jgi:Myosin head (motor domain)
LGILGILDEECRFPQATDLTFLEKLNKNLSKHPNFEIPKMSKNLFCVNHYAGKVLYTVDGMLEKNKDLLSEDLIGTLYSFKSKFFFSCLFFRFSFFVSFSFFAFHIRFHFSFSSGVRFYRLPFFNYILYIFFLLKISLQKFVVTLVPCSRERL